MIPDKAMKFLIFVFIILIISGQNLFAQASDSEVFLFSIEKKDGKFMLAGGKNITNNPGYDNQPSFSLDDHSLLFTSNRNGNNFDIYEYNLADDKVSPIITSENGEYTAKELDKNTITFVREGPGQAMTVIKYDRRTKKETAAFKVKEPIAYYAFNKNGDALVWIRYAFMMHWVNEEKSINKFVADYAQPSVPHLIPKTDKFSFMQRQPNDELWIKEFDPKTQAIRPIIQSKDGKKDYCWMPDGSLLVGSGTKLFRFDEKTGRDWELLADLGEFGIKEITRLSVSFDGKHLALVSNQ
jgi:Tol biopolymer transport system component